MERKRPTTTEQYRASILESMRFGEGMAQRYLREGQELPNNPTGLPEVSMSLRVSGPRQWKAAQALVQDGAAVVVGGSFEGGSVYLVAGPAFPASTARTG